MRVLLTGAAGFVGGHVAEALAEAGHEVVGVDALIRQAHPIGAEPPANVLRLDLRDAARLDVILNGVDVVCHQAAMVGNGIVGRVQDVGERVSRIMLLTDINSRLPILIERTRDQAVLAGNNSDLPDVNYLPRDADIKVGDHVVTSGLGGAFPPGLPVGEVAEIADGKVYVRPFADLGRLEFIRMVDYGLPGVLSEDLGVDAAKAQALTPPSAAVQAPMPPKPSTTQPKLKPAVAPAEGASQ